MTFWVSWVNARSSGRRISLVEYLDIRAASKLKLGVSSLEYRL